MQITLALTILLATAALAPAATTTTFDEIVLPANGNLHTAPITSGGATFSNVYSPAFDSWSGFAVSNVNDPTTPGFGNQYAAITGTDVTGGRTYAVGFDTGTIDLPAGERPASVRLTNTTYAALSIRDGDDFAKKFGGTSGNDPDFFSVTLTGYAGAAGSGAPTGSTTFFLADYRFANNAQDYIVTDWASLDLTGLGNARSIGFGFASSDVGPFGINTPTYFALDNLTTVPEPTTLAALAGVGALAARRRRGAAR